MKKTKIKLTLFLVRVNRIDYNYFVMQKMKNMGINAIILSFSDDLIDIMVNHEDLIDA